MNRFKKGDIVVSRVRNATEIKTSVGASHTVRPWEFGVVVYTHPAYNYVIYNNGKYNQGAWCADVCTVDEWKQKKHNSMIPVYTNGFNT